MDGAAENYGAQLTSIISPAASSSCKYCCTRTSSIIVSGFSTKFKHEFDCRFYLRGRVTREYPSTPVQKLSKTTNLFLVKTRSVPEFRLLQNTNNKMCSMHDHVRENFERFQIITYEYCNCYHFMVYQNNTAE